MTMREQQDHVYKREISKVRICDKIFLAKRSHEEWARPEVENLT